MNTSKNYRYKSSLILSVLLLTPLHLQTASAAEYIIDDQHTHIIWQVDRFGFTNTIGSFTEISGTLDLDEGNLENSSVDASISLAGLRSDLLQREDIVRGPFWLDAENFPSISFKSISLNALQDSTDDNWQATLHGEMNLKGITAPLQMDVQLNKMGTDPVTKRKAIGFSAQGTFTRSDFGIKTAVGPVGNAVSFQIELLAVQAE